MTYMYRKDLFMGKGVDKRFCYIGVLGTKEDI